MTQMYFTLPAYLLVRRRCRQWEDHFFFLVFRSILHVALIHGARGRPATRRGRRRRWQWGEVGGSIRACARGWDPTSWTLRSGRVANAARDGPWTWSLWGWMSTSCSATPCSGEPGSGHIPARKRVGRSHFGKRAWKGVPIWARVLCCWLSQIGHPHSARVGMVGERGRVRASSACHPCRDQARILTADLRRHHIRATCSCAGGVQKGARPSPRFLQNSFSVYAPGKTTTPKVFQKALC